MQIAYTIIIEVRIPTDALIKPPNICTIDLSMWVVRAVCIKGLPNLKYSSIFAVIESLNALYFKSIPTLLIEKKHRNEVETRKNM